MASDQTQKNITVPVADVPGLGAIPVVAVRLPNGQVALRHPDELQKLPAPAPAGGGGE